MRLGKRIRRVLCLINPKLKSNSSTTTFTQETRNRESMFRNKEFGVNLWPLSHHNNHSESLWELVDESESEKDELNSFTSKEDIIEFTTKDHTKVLEDDNNKEKDFNSLSLSHENGFGNLENKFKNTDTQLGINEILFPSRKNTMNQNEKVKRKKAKNSLPSEVIYSYEGNMGPFSKMDLSTPNFLATHDTNTSRLALNSRTMLRSTTSLEAKEKKRQKLNVKALKKSSREFGRSLKTGFVAMGKSVHYGCLLFPNPHAYEYQSTAMKTYRKETVGGGIEYDSDNEYKRNIPLPYFT